MTEAEQLERLCALAGVGLGYHDIWGKWREAPPEALRAILCAMGLPAWEGADLAAAVRDEEERPWRSLLPPVQVVPVDQVPPRVRLHVPERLLERELTWLLVEEGGASHHGSFRPAWLEESGCRELDGARVHGGTLPLPLAPPPGYHRLSLLDEGTELAAMRLIVAPVACYRPEPLSRGERLWGPAVQLYAVRSRRNWGIGDFTDLATLAQQWGRCGAGIVGLNPLHALYPDDPEKASPYSPSSRIFFNVLYLDVEEVADYAECPEAQRRVASAAFRERLARLRAAARVDYAGVAAAKFEVLELLWAHFRRAHLDGDSERGAAFRRFRQEGGRALERHALYEALQEAMRAREPALWGWPAWPEPWRDPDSQEVGEFAAAHRERVAFWQYLQWQAALQLAAAADCARRAGMAVGLYLDLAVSVARGGAESWARQEVSATGASAGAPPDDFNLHGQDWGLPPWSPRRLREAAYEPFIAVLRANMRHAGALRLDHVMGLARLYWVAEGLPADEGVYVHYPLEDLLGILALESQRNRCLVIGEDLGTVPDSMREAMPRMGILSYRVLWFERDWNTLQFKPPREWPALALATVTTHDLATLAGWWAGRDLELRSALELFPTPELERDQREARALDRGRLLWALQQEGLLPPGMGTDPAGVPEMTPALARAIHAYAARSPAQVAMVQMEDVLGEAEQVNLPGTTEDMHPNWRRKLSLDLEDWGEDARFVLLCEAMRRERGG